MSRTFSMNSGSFDNLKVSVRCGCSAKARQMRATVVWLRPLVRAMARVLQWVASRGVDSSVKVSTRSTSASATCRGAPGRGSSSNPSSRWRIKRDRQRFAVAQLICSSRATSRIERPPALANTTRARIAKACAVVGRRAHRSSVSRSCAVIVTVGILGPRAIGASLYLMYGGRRVFDL
jgi:hypothetical protein